jgi:hypothetical protein
VLFLGFKNFVQVFSLHRVYGTLAVSFLGEYLTGRVLQAIETLDLFAGAFAQHPLVLVELQIFDGDLLIVFGITPSH